MLSWHGKLGLFRHNVSSTSSIHVREKPYKRPCLQILCTGELWTRKCLSCCKRHWSGKLENRFFWKISQRIECFLKWWWWRCTRQLNSKLADCTFIGQIHFSVSFSKLFKSLKIESATEYVLVSTLEILNWLTADFFSLISFTFVCVSVAVCIVMVSSDLC